MKKNLKKVATIVAVVVLAIILSTGIVLAYQKQISLIIGSNIAAINGKNIKLDAPAQIVNGRTMVPLRFIAESLGAIVEYHPENKTIDIWHDDGDYYTKTLLKEDFRLVDQEKPTDPKLVSVKAITLATRKKYFRVLIQTTFQFDSGSIECVINNGAGVNSPSKKTQANIGDDVKNKVYTLENVYQADGQEIFVTILYNNASNIYIEVQESDYSDFRP